MSANVKPYSLDRAKRFRGTYCLRFQGQRVNQTHQPAEAGDPADSDDVLDRNVDLSPNYTE